MLLMDWYDIKQHRILTQKNQKHMALLRHLDQCINLRLEAREIFDRLPRRWMNEVVAAAPDNDVCGSFIHRSERIVDELLEPTARLCLHGLSTLSCIFKAKR